MNKVNIALKLLKRRKKVSSVELRDATNTTNPADLIHKLRKAGHDIHKVMRHKGSRIWAEYSLRKAACS